MQSVPTLILTSGVVGIGHFRLFVGTRRCHSFFSPGWFVNVINEVITGLAQVAAYFDDVIVLDSDPTAHVKTIRPLFERLRKHNLKLYPLKARLGATDVNFLDHFHFARGYTPKRGKQIGFDETPRAQDFSSRSLR